MRDVTIPLNALTAFIAFLLTHPVWDVTLMLFYLFHAFCNISTHTSRVGCDLLIYFFELVSNISTHTSRVGCDAIYSILQSQHPHISRDGLIIHLELY